MARLTAVLTQLFSSLSQATRVTDAVDVRVAAGGGMLNISSADRASDVEAARAATSDELARSARPINSPLDCEAVSHGPLETTHCNHIAHAPFTHTKCHSDIRGGKVKRSAISNSAQKLRGVLSPHSYNKCFARGCARVCLTSSSREYADP